jgi:three-Cys-motif partner protein
MGELVEGDDDLLVEDVGNWALEKQKLLCDYIQISSAARRKYLPPDNTGGATYIDLFCGPGRSKIKDTDQFIDGCCVAAWRRSLESASPFTKVIIGDADPERLELARIRLGRLGAPVIALSGEAKDTVLPAIQKATSYGLNFAFLDPYSLGALDFHVLRMLSRLKRIDIMVHFSQMDHQRNYDRNISAEESALDSFAPGWREEVDIAASQRTGRQAVFEYWRGLVEQLGVEADRETRLISGPGNQPLYRLLLVARHELAHRFWQDVTKGGDPQRSLF